MAPATFKFKLSASGRGTASASARGTGSPGPSDSARSVPHWHCGSDNSGLNLISSLKPQPEAASELNCKFKFNRDFTASGNFPARDSQAECQPLTALRQLPVTRRPSESEV